MAKQVSASNSDLTRGKRFTYLSEDVILAGTTIRVQSIVGFESVNTSSGQVICIGEIGNERTEIRRTTNASADGYPSATYKEIGLRDALNFDHPQDTKVYIIDWDRVEFQAAATVTGSKSTILAYPLNIRPDQLETLYVDRTQSSGFYFNRFNNTINSDNSDWSDPVPYAGYDDNMVRSIKDRAIESLGEQIDGVVITEDFLNKSLWEARREYHQAQGKRPFRRKYNVDIGNALTGSFRIELPSDVERPYGAENIYGVRIGANENMQYYDKKDWDDDYRNIPHSTLDVPYTDGVSTSIWVANGRDFSASASINVEGTTIGLSRILGENNSFRIITQGSWDASAGSDVWENVSLGLPDRFTVWGDSQGSAYIYFNRPLDTAYIGMNIYADYYRTLVGFNSDYDTLDEPEYDMYVNYLMAKIKHRRARGSFDITKDPDFQLWLAKKQSALAKEYLSTEIRFAPSIDHLL